MAASRTRTRASAQAHADAHGAMLCVLCPAGTDWTAGVAMATRRPNEKLAVDCCWMRITEAILHTEHHSVIIQAETGGRFSPLLEEETRRGTAARLSLVVWKKEKTCGNYLCRLFLWGSRREEKTRATGQLHIALLPEPRWPSERGSCLYSELTDTGGDIGARAPVEKRKQVYGFITS